MKYATAIRSGRVCAGNGSVPGSRAENVMLIRSSHDAARACTTASGKSAVENPAPDNTAYDCHAFDRRSVRYAEYIVMRHGALFFGTPSLGVQSTGWRATRRWCAARHHGATTQTPDVVGSSLPRTRPSRTTKPAPRHSTMTCVSAAWSWLRRVACADIGLQRRPRKNPLSIAPASLPRTPAVTSSR